ncbi:MAG TPA: hypothetical protein VLK58_12800 [Conexibacter sp.]|nr:hypothetical protein [Conexibacter sp.]
MRRLSLGVAVLVAAALLAPSAASAAWSAQSPINPSGYAAAQLIGASCTGSTFCVTAGRWDNGTPAALIESWTSASTWATQTPATPPAGSTGSGLNGIHCTASTTCTAVGDYTDAGFIQWALVERLSSGTWSLQTMPRPGAAVSTALSGVSCTSSTFCMAVGSYTDSNGISYPLSASWNGSSWTLRTVPTVASSTGTSLSSVSCTSSSACVAVGTYLDSRGVPTPTAVTWSGSAWALLTMVVPRSASATFMTGVSCTSGTACMAVGFATTSGGVVFAVAERLSGTTWTDQTASIAAAPAGATGTSFNGVSCTTSSHCTAVGYYLDASSVQKTFAEAWSGGTSWAHQASPNPASSDGAVFSGVSCTSSSACLAVGYNLDNPSGLQQTLAQRN